MHACPQLLALFGCGLSVCLLGTQKQWLTVVASVEVSVEALAVALVAAVVTVGAAVAVAVVALVARRMRRRSGCHAPS